MKKIVLLLALLGAMGRAQAQPTQLKTEHLILVTIDGLRWQEVFGGADPALLGRHHQPAGSLPPASASRQALLPFLWTTVAAQGQLYGNRALGNYLNVTNKARLSYPGYNEMLTGFAADAGIRNNAKIYNPNTTVLEVISRQPAFQQQVLVYGSWDAFPFIFNAPRSGLPVNAGWQPATGPGLSAPELALNEQLRAIDPHGAERPDSLTFGYAFAHLQRAHPRVLYLALGDTDEHAHAGHYGAYVRAAHTADQYLAQLWDYLQSDPKYCGKTTLLITTDHGRGGNRLGQWAHHSRFLRGSDQTWLAVLGPDTPPTGEQRAPGQLYQHQLAQTIARLLGVAYTNDKLTGAPIEAIFDGGLPLLAESVAPGPAGSFAPLSQSAR
ncbi:phosphoglyceromutase [Hymenobacter bucti]|uniref:Phosphoglyceromutase n=1 Tax=Hymenobacter bucti TaxID=1844114 RepID=A0ABW4R1H3_9BACT